MNQSRSSIGWSACRLFALVVFTASLHAQRVPDGFPTVGIRIVRGETSEPSPLTRVAPAELMFFRTGATENELVVPLNIGGSATPEVDYEAPEKFVRFPVGSATTQMLIGAFQDELVEGDETVAIELTTPPLDGLARYAIDPIAGAAKIIIHDSNKASAGATVTITSPRNGQELRAGLDVEINAVAIDPEGYISTLEFYLDGQLLDTSVIYFFRAPDPGTPVHHTILWKSPVSGKHEIVARGKDSRGLPVSSETIVVVVIGQSLPAVVSILTTDPEGTELPLPVSAIAPLEFEISRTGSTEGSLAVFFSLHGTASKEDYFEVPVPVTIPAGSVSAKLQIVPKADFLKMLEPMETVGVQLEPSPMAGPLPSYRIDDAHSRAGGVIYEQNPPENGSVELIFPARGQGYELGQSIEILAVSYLSANAVDFYDGDQKIGSSGVVVDATTSKVLAFHPFYWRGASAGEHILTARATLPDGKEIISEPALVVVKDSNVSRAYIKITEPGDGQVFRVGSSIQINAVAVDPEGYIPRVEFFANDRQIGVSEIAFFRAPDPGSPITHSLLWENVPAGDYVVTVRGVNSRGSAVTSWPVKITVGAGVPESNATLEIVSPKSGENFEPGSDISVTAIARDPRGYISRVEFFANDQPIGVSEIVFVRAPDPGTPIRHTVVWAGVPAGDYVLTAIAIDSQGQKIGSKVQIVVGSGGSTGDQVVIMVEAADIYGSENTGNGAPDDAAFLIRRIAGPKDVAVTVNLKLAGSAVNGIDYAEIKEQVTIPAGSESVRVVISPIPDKALEGDETVELYLGPVACILIFPPPPECYLVGKAGVARVLIREQSSGTDDVQPKVAIVPPGDATKTARNQPLEIRADASVQGKACSLETTTDLKTWTPVSPIFLPDGQLTYMTEPGTDKQRYYRLRLQ